MVEKLQPILAILDEGLSLYRLNFVGFVAIGSLASLSSSSGAIAAISIVFVGIIFTGIYIFALIVGGATYSSMIYGIQPWVQEARPFGESFQRSFDLIGYRFRRN